MYRFANPYTIGFLAVAAMLFGLAAVAARHRSRRVSALLAVFLVSVGLWTLGDAVRIAAPTATHVLFWNKVAYAGTVLVPPTYLYFVAAVTNRERLFRREYVAAMLGVSVLAYLVVVTNDWHGLWRVGGAVSPGTGPPVLVERRGPLWYVWAVYAYTVIAVGVFFLAAEFLRSTRSRLYRNQVGLVLAGVLVAWGGNLLFTLFDVVQFDPLPIALSVTGVTFAAAIWRNDLLDITPIARDVVLENLDGGVVVVDADDTVVDANRRARTVLDLDEEAVPGAALETALAASPGAIERLREARDASETVAVGTGDRQRHFEVDVSPIENDLGTCLGRAVVFTEVTERIRRERDLRDRTARLRRQNERFDELAELVSHDLRNPLDVTGRRVRRIREVLDETDVPADARGDIEAELDGIERATGRAGDIAGELLTLSREELDVDVENGGGSAGTDDPAAATPDDRGAASSRAVDDGSGSDDVDPVGLRAVAGDAWDTVDTGGLELSVRGSRAIPADEGSLRHLLENLFRNAVEHADEASSVVVGATSEGFFVEDDGSGIPPEARERALERGYSMAPDGSGLGLAVVRDVADDHGWTVELTESAGGGVRVEVVLEGE